VIFFGPKVWPDAEFPLDRHRPAIRNF
jgi:hypothetical protein